jgi:protein phosphatase
MVAMTTPRDIAPGPGFLDLGTVSRDRFEGVLVVPDVHGHPDALDAAATRARDERLFLLQLGDLVDRGPSSAMAVAVMREVVERGEGAFLVGNHEHKLARLAREGTYATSRRLETLSELQSFGDGLLDWYLERIERGIAWARAPRAVFAHASFHPEMIRPEPRIDAALLERAMFGPVRRVTELSRPVRDRTWVQSIPRGLRVYVGHQVLSRGAPARERSQRGGSAVFLDTGGWQGGAWSTVVLSWDDVG